MSVTLQRPIVTLISEEIERRLQTLIGGDAGTYTFTDVVRPTRLAQHTPKHGMIVLTRGDITRVAELDCPGNPPANAYRQIFLIKVHIAPSENDTTPVEVYEDDAEAQILAAIRTDGTWHTFDSNAINADFGAQMIAASSDGSYDGITIPLYVTFRIAEGDHYTARP